MRCAECDGAMCSRAACCARTCFTCYVLRAACYPTCYVLCATPRAACHVHTAWLPPIAALSQFRIRRRQQQRHAAVVSNVSVTTATPCQFDKAATISPLGVIDVCSVSTLRPAAQTGRTIHIQPASNHGRLGLMWSMSHANSLTTKLRQCPLRRKKSTASGTRDQP